MMSILSNFAIIIIFSTRPVIIEVPHFASLRGKEREIVILRSDNGETWREHTLEASEEAVQDVLNESFEGEGTTISSSFLNLAFVYHKSCNSLLRIKINRTEQYVHRYIS